MLRNDIFSFALILASPHEWGEGEEKTGRYGSKWQVIIVGAGFPKDLDPWGKSLRKLGYILFMYN
jgi:hypothetical protein